MTLFETMAPGALGPGIASGIVFGVGVLLTRVSRKDGWRGAFTGLALAVGFSVGFLVVRRTWPSLPLEAGRVATDWVAWFAPAGFVLGLLGWALRLKAPIALPLRFLAALGAAWLLLSPHAGLEAAEKWTRALLTAAAASVIWVAAAAPADRDEAPGVVALPFMVAAGTTAAVFALLANSVSLGQLAGSLSAALGAAWGLGFLLKQPAASRTGAGVITLVFAGLLLSGHTYLNYGTQIHFPALAAGLLALGPVLGVLVGRAVSGKVPPLATAVLSTLPVLLLAGLAAWAQQAGAPTPSPGPY